MDPKLENNNQDKQLVVAHRITTSPNGIRDDSDDNDDERCQPSLIDHNWSKKILELVGNRAQLMESFSWLSTVGGGFSSLGERDKQFSMKAATLSLGYQLRLAEQLGDQKLKVMCHLFAAIAALQLDNRDFCINYIAKVILPMMNQLPYRDPILINMLRHIYFRLDSLDKFMLNRYAIMMKGEENGENASPKRSVKKLCNYRVGIHGFMVVCQITNCKPESSARSLIVVLIRDPTEQLSYDEAA